MEKIINFFNHHSEFWDSYQKEEEKPIIRKILEFAEIKENDIVLDVACGTGVLIPFLNELNIKHKNITAIDIAPKMIERFREKFPDIKTIAGDFLSEKLIENSYSKIIIFNSFPHFINFEKVFKKSYNLLKQSGRLIIAHTMNRKALNEYHKNVGSTVKKHSLLEDEEFKFYYTKYKFKKIMISDDKFFYSQGQKII